MKNHQPISFLLLKNRVLRPISPNLFHLKVEIKEGLFFLMEEFDYLLTWVTELCNADEKSQFESALLVAEVDEVWNEGLPTVWAYIWDKIEKEIGSHDGYGDGFPRANPRYIGFLELCKKNPTLVDGNFMALDCVTDAALDMNLAAVMRMRYPSWDKSSWKPWVEESNETVETENNQTDNSPNQPVPNKNIMRERFDDMQ